MYSYDDYESVSSDLRKAQKDTEELQQRLIDKTDAFMKHDLKQVVLIRKMEQDIKEAWNSESRRVLKGEGEEPNEFLGALYYRYVVKNPKTFE